MSIALSPALSSWLGEGRTLRAKEESAANGMGQCHSAIGLGRQSACHAHEPPNRVGGRLAASPSHTTGHTHRTRRFPAAVGAVDRVKARCCSNTASACGSARAPGPVPPSPVAPWRSDACRAWSNRSCWSPPPCCRFTPIELAQTAPWLLNSALRRTIRCPATTASADSSSPVRCRCRHPAPVARRSEQVSQGKTLLLRSGAAGFTCARVQVTIGRPRPLPGYPTAPASYPISVRRLRTRPPASSPPRLTATQLPSVCDSHHQGSQRTYTSCINAMPGTQKVMAGT